MQVADNENQKKALAELEVCLEHGWPLGFRDHSDNECWSWVKFDSDRDLRRGIWTLFIKFDETPTANKSKYLVSVYFMAPEAPQEFLFAGSEFELFSGHGEIIKGKGRITEIDPQ